VAWLLAPQRAFSAPFDCAQGRLRQHGNSLLFRLILRLRRKIKRIETVFPRCRRRKKAIAVATA
jgi:hypothetical protein